MFSRSSWKGILVVDKENKNIIFLSVQKNTLDRITKNKTRRSPHYAQTMVNTINKDEVAEVKQMTIADIDATFAGAFTEEDFEKDFFAIMEETVCELCWLSFFGVIYV